MGKLKLFRYQTVLMLMILKPRHCSATPHPGITLKGGPREGQRGGAPEHLRAAGGYQVSDVSTEY